MRWIAMKYAIINRKDEGICVMYVRTYTKLYRKKKLWCINFITYRAEMGADYI